MANPKHVELVKKGADSWQRWVMIQKDPFRSKADLSEADLSGVDLSKVSLPGADCHDGEFEGTDFGYANLTAADFNGAILRGANLSHARCERATFRYADLTGANLAETDLWEACLSVAHLRHANLRGASLPEADLRGAHASEANLKHAILAQADLWKADLRGVDLREAVLSGAHMPRVDLRGANITGAHLYGTARDDWQIEGIKCEFVYWDESGSCRTPKDRDFLPGEFEEVYRQLPTFEYVFENGFAPLDATIMDAIVRAINEEHPEFDLKLDSFTARGHPRAVFTVVHKDNVEPARVAVSEDYEYLCGVCEELKRVQDAQAQTMQTMRKLLAEPRTKIVKEKIMGSKYEIHDVKASGHSQLHFGDRINKVSDPELKTMLTTISELIDSAGLGERKKHDALEDLGKLTEALTEEHPDKSRITKFYNGIAQYIPAISSAVTLARLSLFGKSRVKNLSKLG